MKQLKYFVNVPILLLMVLGAYAPHADAKLKGEPQKDVTKEVVATELKPFMLPPSGQKVVATSPELLKNSPNAMDYVEIGQITIRRLKEACFDGKCDQYLVKDPTDILITKAAEHGGTHVVFEMRDNVRVPVYRDSDKCEIEVEIGRRVPAYDYRGAYIGTKIQTSPYCSTWYEEEGNGIWYEVKATIWRLDRAIAHRLRELDPQDLRPVIFESTGRFATFACGQDRCCGYKSLVTETTIFEPTALACSPFFKKQYHLEGPNSAIVFLAEHPPWHVKEYGPSVYIINNQGEKVRSCSKMGSISSKPSVNDMDCAKNEECLRNLVSCAEGTYCCTPISSN